MRTSRFLVALGLVLSLPSCGGGGKGSGSPTAPTAAGSPTASPQPSASPSPSPTPSPTSAASCHGLPPATGTPRGCVKGSSSYFNQVKDAVSLAQASTYRDPASGQMFDVVLGNGQIQVVSAYVKTITDALDRQGLCATFDGEEIGVREHNGYNENFDVITAEGHSWVNYVVTCTPALPAPQPTPAPPQQDPDCRLPASAFVYCAKQTSAYDGDVFDAQDALIEEDRARATPQVFNFNDRFSSAVPYGYRIVNEPQYVTELLKKLKARGFCAYFDGAEFQVKRSTNVFSEHFDMTRADGYAIRLYNSSCRDAAF